MIKTQITGNGEKKVVDLDNRNGIEPNSLVVATRDLKEFYSQTFFFVNSTYGSSMNVAGGEFTSSENIYDGEDNVYWTFSIVEGGAGDFEVSTDQNHTAGGTQSLDATGSKDNDTCQFERPAGDLILNTYTSLIGWIYYENVPLSLATTGIRIYAWDTNTNTQVGVIVDIYDYTTPTITGTWQQFSIPLSDMNLVGETIDSIRVTSIDTGPGGAPDYYLDDISLQAAGGGAGTVQYTVRPTEGTWYHAQEIKITMYGYYDTTVANGTVPGMDVSTFLGTDTTAGILLQIVKDQRVFFRELFRSPLEFLELTGSRLDTITTDSSLNTLLVFRHEFNEPIILKARELDRMRININDNFSTLDTFVISVGGKTEVRGLK